LSNFRLASPIGEPPFKRISPRWEGKPKTAASAAGPPIALTVIDAIFSGLGLTPSKVRQDRILDEARQTADPVHLMHVFGLTAHPAMKYVQAAHPERGPAMPR
jgi:hypothetical protein